jgi:ABC-type sugar transport system substrate-binding protein
LRNFLIIIILLTTHSLFNKVLAINVTYISQTEKLTPYWTNTYAAARAAANDLGINLTIIEGQGHRLLQSEVLTELSLSPSKPDLLIFHAFPQNALKYFNLLEKANIAFVTYSNFSGDSKSYLSQQLGYPQEKFKYWLSEHYVENFKGAAQLTHSLISQAKDKLKNKYKQLKVVALSGDLILESTHRSQGVAAQIKQEVNVTLVQDVIANWKQEEARIKFKRLYARHGRIDVVWASSDVMAMGALQGAKELNLIPNKDIFIGGFDWDTEAINNIKSRQLSASAGGQFYNIAWLLVQIYDHFASPTTSSLHKSQINDKYSIIDLNNLTNLAPLTNINNIENINFYCFTKAHTKQQGYNFSLSLLLKQLNRQSNTPCK